MHDNLYCCLFYSAHVTAKSLNIFPEQTKTFQFNVLSIIRAPSSGIYSCDWLIDLLIEQLLTAIHVALLWLIFTTAALAKAGGVFGCAFCVCLSVWMSLLRRHN